MTTNERLTLTISTIALVVSALSLWDSHDSSNVHRAEAAPHLAILSADFTRPTLSDPRFLVLILPVINAGEIGVTATEAELHPQLFALPGQESIKTCYDDLNKQSFKDPNSKDLKLEEKVAPKGKGVGIVSVIIQLPPSCSETGWKFVGTVDFRGHDDAGHSYDSRHSADQAIFGAIVPKI
jgi:hypothetical protein